MLSHKHHPIGMGIGGAYISLYGGLWRVDWQWSVVSKCQPVWADATM